MAKTHPRIGIIETFGLNPLIPAISDTLTAAFGKGKLPPTRIGVSSTRIFKPQIAIPTWLGIRTGGRKVPIYNFFNRERPPLGEAFSVKVTFARDFRGRQWTYDSHSGVDFAVPVGTPTAAPAPGKVLRIVNFLDHGGLKIIVDHGDGLITTYCHLARALVQEGENVSRGQTLGLCGASGTELIVFFPWVSPHLHLNVWLNGMPADPFAIEEQGEVSLWRHGNSPKPYNGPPDTSFTPTVWDETLLERAIAACRDADEKQRLRAIPDIERRAVELLILRNFRSPLFTDFPPVYDKEYPREPRLTLPFKSTDFDGVLFPDNPDPDEPEQKKKNRTTD